MLTGTYTDRVWAWAMSTFSARRKAAMARRLPGRIRPRVRSRCTGTPARRNSSARAPSRRSRHTDTRKPAAFSRGSCRSSIDSMPPMSMPK